MKKLLAFIALATSVAPAFAGWDIAAQCRIDEQAGALQEMRLPESLLKEGSASQIAEYYLTHPSASYETAPWHLSQATEARLREAGFLVQVALARTVLLRNFIEVPADAGVPWFHSYFLDRSNLQLEYDPALVQKTKTLIEKLRKEKGEYDPALAKLGARALCLRHGAFRCADQLVDILEFMRPVGYGGAMFSALELWDEVLTEEPYRRAITLLAARVLERISSRQPGGSLVEDAREAFGRVFPRPDAESKMWKYLGWYSTRGVSVHLTRWIYHAQNADLGVANYIISAGINVLDALGAPQRYSLPPGIEAGCEFGKPYHFWMAAYLARREREKFGDRSGAMTASYISGYGYEFQAKTTGREPVSDLLTLLYERRKNRIRFILGFKAAGALYGAYGDSTRQPILIDDWIKQSFEDAKELKKKPYDIWRDSQDPWKRFRMQLDVFAPDTNYKLAKKAADQAGNSLLDRSVLE